MKKQLMIALLAATGLAACGDERANQASVPAAKAVTTPSVPVPATPQAAPAATAGQMAAQDEKKDEAKTDDGAKKSQ